MTQPDLSPVGDLVDRTAVDPDGDRIGAVVDIYLDNVSGEPEWLTVTTSPFGSTVNFVPIAGALLVDGVVVVAYPWTQVKDAPWADVDGDLSARDEDALFAHYGRGGMNTGRARLRRWVETEELQMTVPILRARDRAVVEAMIDTDRDDVMAGGDLHH